MFIIWGFGHKTVKRFTLMENTVCRRCNNTVNREMLKVTTWFTLFFIPLIPYSKKYFITCPICGGGAEISRYEYDEMSRAAGAGQGYAAPGVQYDSGHASEPTEEQKAEIAARQEAMKYHGKTETQIAYLKQMEEFENSKDAKTDN